MIRKTKAMPRLFQVFISVFVLCGAVCPEVRTADEMFVDLQTRVRAQAFVDALFSTADLNKK